MKEVGITYEVTRRYYEKFIVTDDEYEEIYEGNLPERIAKECEDHIDELDGDREDDWTAVDEITGKVLQDWR